MQLEKLINTCNMSLQQMEYEVDFALQIEYLTRS